jgi:biotin transporter BioY
VNVLGPTFGALIGFGLGASLLGFLLNNFKL